MWVSAQPNPRENGLQISTGSHPNGSWSKPEGAKRVGLGPRENAGIHVGNWVPNRALSDGGKQCKGAGFELTLAQFFLYEYVSALSFPLALSICTAFGHFTSFVQDMAMDKVNHDIKYEYNKIIWNTHFFNLCNILKIVFHYLYFQSVECI
jgi:hypothetical protein